MPGACGQEKSCTVTQALNAAKRGLEQIGLSVVGEVSQVSNKPTYKAVYFTIRDQKSTLDCIIWRDRFNAQGVDLAPGKLVEVQGKFTCYAAQGRMQFSVARIAPAGEGKLRLQTAMLARKLEAEGLMDPARKRGLKALPKRIAVVTSPSGKAIHDVVRTLRRRYPLGELLVFGVTVEGAGAPDSIISGLQAACTVRPAPDVILLVRGGGSYEALMPFNDERVARAVVACTVPVVTGIGHEPDNSICDMVADRRFSTPTAAAEGIAPTMEQLAGKVANATAALTGAMGANLEGLRHRLARVSDRPVWTDPHYLTGSMEQQLDYLADRLARAIPEAVTRDAAALSGLEGRLQRALPALLAPYGMQLSQSRQRLHGLGASLVDAYASDMALAAAKLDALSPLKVLSRGYSIAYAADGRTVIDRTSKAALGDPITVQMQDGRLSCTVDSIERSVR